MILDLVKVQKTYEARNKFTDGLTCVAFYCMDELNWYDTLTQKINDTLKARFDDLYFSYACNRHITIMGLEGVSKINHKNICMLIQSFPQIEIDRYMVRIVPNGLIVVEFFLTSESQVLLSQFRKSFQEFGVDYKHLASIHKLHSVLGQILPEKLQNMEVDKLNGIEEDLLVILDRHINSFEKNNSIEQCDLKIIKYQQTSLLKSYAIACEDIF